MAPSAKNDLPQVAVVQRLRNLLYCRDQIWSGHVDRVCREPQPAWRELLVESMNVDEVVFVLAQPLRSP